VQQPWVRWLPAGLPAAGYATLVNSGDTPASLVGVSSPDYGAVMIHRSLDRSGMERMVMVNAIPVPPHGRTALAPGGYHLMLMQPRHAIRPGMQVSVRFEFSDGSTIDVAMPVRPANASD
jgi:copper(I)-binding protein